MQPRLIPLWESALAPERRTCKRRISDAIWLQKSWETINKAKFKEFWLPWATEQEVDAWLGEIVNDLWSLFQSAFTDWFNFLQEGIYRNTFLWWHHLMRQPAPTICRLTKPRARHTVLFFLWLSRWGWHKLNKHSPACVEVSTGLHPCHSPFCPSSSVWHTNRGS